MPKRKRVKEYTGGPQGVDALLVMKISTIGEMNSNKKKILALKKNGDDDESKEAVEIESQRMLISQVISWNWVDDEGVIIDLPQDRAGIFEMLTTEEAEYLGECFNGKTKEQIADQKK